MLEAAWLAAGAVALAQRTPGSGKGYEAYPMVRTKNIFDPQRYPSSMSAAPVATAPSTPPPKASDFVALTGIMVTGDKALAFFSGSRADYDKVVPVNSDIAGAKVTRITPSNVEVERGGRKIVVAVGQTVPFDGSAPGVAPTDFVAGAGAASGPGAGEAAPGASNLSDKLSEVMRRMMERRQQQLK